MAETSTKPYLIRAIHEWCSDNGFTPYLAVVVADERTRVPREFVRNGEIVLNVSVAATHHLAMGNELIEFQARFGGVARQLSIPVDSVSAIYARENGHGMAFEVRGAQPAETAPAPAGDRSEGAGPRGRRRGAPTLTAVDGESAAVGQTDAPVITAMEHPAAPQGPVRASPTPADGAPVPESSPDQAEPSPDDGGASRRKVRPRLTRVK